ncbi:hypothetical protein AB0I91_38595 [Actinosynnema sp. NPDC049800]
MDAGDTGSATASGNGSTANTGNLFQPTINIGFPEAPPPAPAPSGAAAKPGRAVGGAIAAVVLLMILFSCFSDPDEDFTEDSGARPSAATNDHVATAVREALRNCAKAVVLTPLNCPQVGSSTAVGNQVVSWTLHGDPADGYQAAWRDDHFNVRGNVVMSVVYQDYWGEKLSTYVFGYQTRVDWHDDRPSVGPIGNIAALSDAKIQKRVTGVSLDELRPLMRAMFRECEEATSIPLPLKCPQAPNLAKREQVSWTFTGDPILNVSITFDKSSGLIHVTGSYASEVSYEAQYSGATKHIVSGNFDALIMVEGDEPSLLQILRK